MCRYAMYGPYKDHYACFACRKMFRKPGAGEMARPPRQDEVREVPCPQCGAPMKDMGLDFKAPKQMDVKQWKKVAMLYARGIAFHSCGCGGPGPRPATLREVAPFLAEQESLREEHARRENAARWDAERAQRRGPKMPEGQAPRTK
jgi:hypothetical protein